MSPNSQNFDRNIFINCPFDAEYKQMLRALIFTVLDCGFRPRIASEREDAGEVRVNKIKELIRESRYSIHDISRMDPLKNGDFPRFNMPFELGLDLGCREFGDGQLSEKRCLILDKERFRYQKVISDISGYDIKAHHSETKTLVRRVREWLRAQGNPQILSGNKIWGRFNEFYDHFIKACESEQLGYDEEDIENMPIVEYLYFIEEWHRLTQEQN